MDLDKEVYDGLNKQITHELEAWYTYLSLSAYFESKTLLGAAFWMRKQAEEEMGHAMKIFDYIHQRGAKAELGALPKPASSFPSVVAAFEAALAHEQKNTAHIYALLSLAESKSDEATVSFLKWFVDEQVEEEDSARKNLDLAKMCGDSAAALLQLDALLAKRKEGD
ncbi:MAG: ferritin [Candidatus Micrarchaeota archaeon]|nr:ferritin [Candidatus Micrarchaeota archaeon]